MFDTIALLLSDIHHALGHLPREFVEPEDLARAAFKTLAFRGLTAQQSEFGRTSKVSAVFYPASRDTLLTQAPDIMLPSYIEIRSGTSPNEFWDWVPAVGSSNLEESRNEGKMRCNFEREESGFRLRLSYDPSSIPHRLRYYTDPVIPGTLNDPLPLPPRFGFMFSDESLINAVPMVLMRSAALPEAKQLSVAQLSAISAAVAVAQSQIEKWDPLWKTENTANRNPQGRDRTPILSRGRGVRGTY